MNLRSQKKYNNDLSLQDTLTSDADGNEIALIDVISDPADDIIDQVNLKLQIKKLYDKMKTILKGREKDVISMRYGLGLAGEKTQREIASILGISRSYVSRIEKKALNKLWKEMNE